MQTRERAEGTEILPQRIGKKGKKGEDRARLFGS